MLNREWPRGRYESPDLSTGRYPEPTADFEHQLPRGVALDVDDLISGKAQAYPPVPGIPENSYDCHPVVKFRPVALRRQLSIELPRPTYKRNAFSKQPDAPIFRLPQEIREIIWRDVIGEVQVSSYPGDHISEGTERDCFPRFKLDKAPQDKDIGRLFSDAFAPSPRALKLALVLTCRRLYLETIHMLYDRSRFYVNSLLHVGYLHRLLLPQRVDTIQWLNITETTGLSTDLFHAWWHKACRDIASMRDLRYLKILLGRPQRHRDDRMRSLAPLEPFIRRELSGIRQVDEMHLVLCFLRHLPETCITSTQLSARVPAEPLPECCTVERVWCAHKSHFDTLRNRYNWTLNWCYQTEDWRGKVISSETYDTETWKRSLEEGVL